MLAKKANRGTPGATSRKSSCRLPARSGVNIDRPVTLPPGRARLATRPVPTASPMTADTIGMTDVACFAATTGECPQRKRDGRRHGSEVVSHVRRGSCQRNTARFITASASKPKCWRVLALRRCRLCVDVQTGGFLFEYCLGRPRARSRLSAEDHRPCLSKARSGPPRGCPPPPLRHRRSPHRASERRWLRGDGFT